MKSMKKLVTLLLSLVMLCALAMPAMAEGEDAAKTYSITIDGAVAGHTYKAYQVFSGDYFYGDGNNHTDKDKEYLSNVVWGKGVDGEAIVTELKADTTLEALRSRFGSVTAKDTDAAEKVAYILQNLGDKSEELDEFARIVGKHLTQTTAGTTGKLTAVENVNISNLAAGYYFVKDAGDINAGEIATKFLVKVVGDATVEIKATAPTIDKKIVDNGDTNRTSANIGDQVEFKLTATVPDMANFDTYTFTISDTMSNGLTFDEKSVVVTIDGTQLKAGDNYTLTPPKTDNTFKIDFTKKQLGDKVKHTEGATIVVTYKATLNSNALTTDKETNKAKLEYSNNPSNSEDKGTVKTPDVPTYIYNFNIDVDKYDGTDGTTNTDNKLKDAVFVLYKKDGTNKKYYKWNKDSKKVEWVSEADKTTATPKTTDEKGKATFEGLKEGTYYLEETTAPKGYNTLKEPVEVTIGAVYNVDGTLDTDNANFKLKPDAEKNNHYYQVQSIANKAGAVLPSTGGIGTTIFYVLGSILALGAAVLLIAKKRMNGQDR